MKRAALVATAAAAAALAGCSNILGIEVLTYETSPDAGPGPDASDGGGVPETSTVDSPAVDAPPETSIVCTAKNSVNCGGTCVDITSDPYNCGVCGQTCTGTTCSDSACVAQVMCDGSNNDAGIVNTGNASRLGFQSLTGVGGPFFTAYFSVDGLVYDCSLTTKAPAPPPAPGVDALQASTKLCYYGYNEVASDKTTAYTHETSAVECHGSSIVSVADGTSFAAGTAFGSATLVTDVSASSGVYMLASPVLDLMTLSTDDAGTSTATAVSCVTVNGTLSDGAIGGGYAVAVDGDGGVVRGASASGGSCNGAKVLATGVTGETAIAVAPNGQVFAYADTGGVFLCPTTGCTGTQSTTAFAPNPAIPQFGLIFDNSTPPNLYAATSLGIVRCSGAVPGTVCTPTLLAPNFKATSGIGLDGTYVYFLEGMTLYRVPK